MIKMIFVLTLLAMFYACNDTPVATEELTDGQKLALAGLKSDKGNNRVRDYLVDGTDDYEEAGIDTTKSPKRNPSDPFQNIQRGDIGWFTNGEQEGVNYETYPLDNDQVYALATVLGGHTIPFDGYNNKFQFIVHYLPTEAVETPGYRFTVGPDRDDERKLHWKFYINDTTMISDVSHEINRDYAKYQQQGLGFSAAFYDMPGNPVCTDGLLTGADHWDLIWKTGDTSTDYFPFKRISIEVRYWPDGVGIMNGPTKGFFKYVLKGLTHDVPGTENEIYYGGNHTMEVVGVGIYQYGAWLQHDGDMDPLAEYVPVDDRFNRKI